MNKFLLAKIHISSKLYSLLPIMSMFVGIVGIHEYKHGPIWAMSLIVIGYGWIVAVSRFTHFISARRQNHFWEKL